MNTDKSNFAHQDIGYLLTAYADGQLAPDGVMWVEEQLDRNAELRAKLKEIRRLQAGLRQAFAGKAPTYVLELPRRDALLAQAALTKNKKMNIISFRTALRLVAAASIVLCVLAISMPNLLESRTPAMARQKDQPQGVFDAESLDPAGGNNFYARPAASAPSASAQPDSLAALDAPVRLGEKSSFGNRSELNGALRYAGEAGPVGDLAQLADNKSAAPHPTGFTSNDDGVVYAPPLAKAERGRLINSLADEQRKSEDAQEVLAQASGAWVPRDSRKMEQKKEVDAIEAAKRSQPMTTTITKPAAPAPMVVMPSSPSVGANRPQQGPAEVQQLARMDSDKKSVQKQLEAKNIDPVSRQLTESTFSGNENKAREETVALSKGGGGGFTLFNGVPAERSGGSSTLSGKQTFEWMTSSAKLDPRMSLATLIAPVTNENTGRYGELLWMISSDKIAYQVTLSAQSLLGQSGLVQLRDEPVSRGVIRIARSVNLQAQFTGGIVHLDVAQRPLDPTDSQGFELPTFRTLMGTSPMQSIAIDPVQTVAIDADTASYAYAKARIAAGEMVDASTIKPEHFINAMPMDYPKAQGPEAFSLYAEAAPSPFARANTPWGARTALVSIGAVAKPAAADERRPLALTLAVDCSGSMAQPGALDRIKIGLQTLISNLRAEDRVSVVAFGDQARVVLPATPGNDPNTVLTALQTLTIGGATNAAEGLTLAYQLAAETAAPGVESRVLLATDGGTVAGADDLLRRVTAFKDRGITLVVVGCGQTYRAGPLQELATKGDGQHFFVGSDNEAQTLFSTTLLPDRLAVLAKDAKLQVTWNPQRISHARLIGYDQRRLATKDFRDNSIDAGELSQDTQVTALFEVLLVDGGTGPLGNAAVRYYDTRREQVRELACPLPGSILASQPSDRLRLLACAATTAEWLQRGWWSNVHLITPAEITAQLKRCPQPIAAELRKMVEHKAE